PRRSRCWSRATPTRSCSPPSGPTTSRACTTRSPPISPPRSSSARSACPGASRAGAPPSSPRARCWKSAPTRRAWSSGSAPPPASAGELLVGDDVERLLRHADEERPEEKAPGAEDRQAPEDREDLEVDRQLQAAPARQRWAEHVVEAANDDEAEA